MRLQFPLTAYWRQFLLDYNEQPPSEGALIQDPRARYVLPLTDVLGISGLPTVQPEIVELGSPTVQVTLPASIDEWRGLRVAGLDITITPQEGHVLRIVGASVLYACPLDDLRQIVVPATQEPPYGWNMLWDSEPGLFPAAWNEFVTEADVIPLLDNLWWTYSDVVTPTSITDSSPELKLNMVLGLPPLATDIDLQMISTIFLSRQRVGLRPDQNAS